MLRPLGLLLVIWIMFAIIRAVFHALADRWCQKPDRIKYEISPQPASKTL